MCSVVDQLEQLADSIERERSEHNIVLVQHYLVIDERCWVINHGDHIQHQEHFNENQKLERHLATKAWSMGSEFVVFCRKISTQLVMIRNLPPQKQLSILVFFPIHYDRVETGQVVVDIKASETDKKIS